MLVQGWSQVCPHVCTVRHVYTVKRAAELTGIAPHTLRAWERRYGVVVPHRSDGGFRLYDDEALRRLGSMHALVRSGWSAAQAAAQVLSAESVDVAATTAEEAASEGAGHPGTLGDTGSLARAGRDMDVRALEAALDEGFALGSFEQVVDRWLMPALADVGDQWRDGRLGIAGEHFVSASVQRRLAAAFDAAGRPVRGRPVVVGLPHGARHELGVLAFATALRRAGADVLYVGADLPTASWAETVRRHQATAVVLGVVSAEDVPAAREVVETIRGSRPDVAIHLGGRHQDLVPGSLGLGHLIGAAARSLAEGRPSVA